MTFTEVLREAGVTYEEALELHRKLVNGANETAEALKGLGALIDRRIMPGTETSYSLRTIRWELLSSLTDDNDIIEDVFCLAFPDFKKSDVERI